MIFPHSKLVPSQWAQSCSSGSDNNRLHSAKPELHVRLQRPPSLATKNLTSQQNSIVPKIAFLGVHRVYSAIVVSSTEYHTTLLRSTDIIFMCCVHSIASVHLLLRNAVAGSTTFKSQDSLRL